MAAAAAGYTVIVILTGIGAHGAAEQKLLNYESSLPATLSQVKHTKVHSNAPFPHPQVLMIGLYCAQSSVEMMTRFVAMIIDAGDALLL